MVGGEGHRLHEGDAGERGGGAAPEALEAFGVVDVLDAREGRGEVVRLHLRLHDVGGRGSEGGGDRGQGCRDFGAVRFRPMPLAWGMRARIGVFGESG